MIFTSAKQIIFM